MSAAVTDEPRRAILTLCGRGRAGARSGFAAVPRPRPVLNIVPLQLGDAENGELRNAGYSSLAGYNGLMPVWWRGRAQSLVGWCSGGDCGVAAPKSEQRRTGPRRRLELETPAATQAGRVPSISDEELDTRVARVRAELAARGLKGLIAYSAHRDYQPGDLRYLARWLCKEEESACLHIPVDGKTTLITNATWDLRRAQHDAHADQAMYAAEFADVLKDLLAPGLRSGDRIGISGWSFFPAPTYVGLTTAFPGVTFSDETDILTSLRIVKSEAELDLIRAACRITDAGMRAGLEVTHEGVTEIDIATAAEAMIRSRGAEPSFIFEIGSGTRTAAGICLPTSRRIGRGDIVTIDVGGMVEGYHGDMARALVIGGPNEVQRRLLEAVDSSHAAAVAAIRPGLTIRELNAIAADAVAKMGLGENWVGDFMPHGLGTAQHEAPEFPKDSDVELRPGMVLAIEPVVVVPEVGGVIAEHMIAVTDGGAEQLSEMPTDVWRSFT